MTKKLNEMKERYAYLLKIDEKVRAYQLMREIRKLESNNAI